jgi:hypothetical protein
VRFWRAEKFQRVLRPLGKTWSKRDELCGKAGIRRTSGLFPRIFPGRVELRESQQFVKILQKLPLVL